MLRLLCLYLCCLAGSSSIGRAQNQIEQDTIAIANAYRALSGEELRARSKHKTVDGFDRWRRTHRTKAWRKAEPFLERKLLPDGHFFLAGMLASAERWDDTIRHLSAYLDSKETDRRAHALTMRMQARVRAGYFEDAVRDFKQMRKEYPDQVSFSLFHFALPALQNGPHRKLVERVIKELEKRYAGDQHYEKVVADFHRMYRRVGQPLAFPKAALSVDDVRGAWQRNRLHLVVFFRTSVENSHRVIKFVGELERDFGPRGLDVLGVTKLEGEAFHPNFRISTRAPGPREELGGLRRMREMFRLKAPLVVARDDSLEKSFGVAWLPHLFLVDGSGTVICFWAGAEHYQWLKPLIEKHLPR